MQFACLSLLEASTGCKRNRCLCSLSAGSAAKFNGLRSSCMACSQPMLQCRNTVHCSNRSADLRKGGSMNIMKVRYAFDCRMPHSASPRQVHRHVHWFARPAVERKDSTPRNQTLLDKQKPPREQHKDHGGPISIRLSNASLDKPAPYPKSCMLRSQPHEPVGGLTGCKRRHFFCAGFSLL